MLGYIGDHKRAETRIADRDAQLDLAGKIAQIGSFTYDHATQKLQLSRGCAAIYGLPEDALEISREVWRALVHPDDMRRLDAVTRRALANRETEIVLEFRTLRRGEVRWIEARVFIVYDEAGRPIRRIGAQVDVTDRKCTEDTLHQREAELVEAQRLARIGSWHWDAGSNVIVGSDELLRIFGLDPGTRQLPVYREQRGRWYPDDDWKRLKAAMQSAMQTGASYELELQAFRKGTPIWITARGAVVIDSRNQIVGLRGTVQEITDRKLAELTLAERNTQLELASKAARVGSFSIDFSTGVVKLTPGCATVFGLPEGITEMSRDDARKLVHPEDLPLLEVRHDHALLAQQREITSQFRIVCANDGEVRWIEVRNLIFYDHSGKPAHLIGVSIDFTQRKVAEEMLAERNLQLEAAGKVGLVGSYVYDAETEKMQISAGYAAIYGFPGRTTEITYGEWRAHVHPEDVEGFQVLRSETYQERRGEYKVDFRIVRRDGETRWIESRGFILYGSDARAQRVIGVNIDVTDRKRAELALAERNAQLALAASAARVGCYSNNIETGLIAVSEGYVAIHGLHEGTVHTTLGEWRTRVHPDDLAPFDELREQLFGSRQREFTFDYRLVRADGGIRWIESRGCISYGKDGLPQQCIGINIDVTERKQTEARLSDALSAGRVVAFEWDAATCRSQRSANAEHILGIVQGGVFLRQVHRDDRRNFKTIFRNLSPGNPSYKFIFRFARSDSDDVWLEEEAKAEFDTKGKLLRIKGLTRDITERKQIEEALKESEAALRERLEALPAAIFVTDIRGRVTYCNQAAADLWGKMPKFGEDRWCDLARLYHSDGTPMAIEDCPTEIALKGGRIVRKPEAILERADGTRIPIIPYPNPLRNGAGTIVGTLNMTVDISERKNAELALAERNIQFDLAEKAALVGSYAFDLDTKVVRVSEGYAALHGLPERTPITTGHKWRASTHPEDVIRIERVWKEAFRAHRGEYDIEYRIVRDGKIRWIYSRSFISYGSNGRAQRVVGVNIDITERKRAEEHQRLLVAELDHRVKNALATVSAIAAHTLDGSNSMEHFVAALDGRIRSMASSHELLSCRRWEGIPLAELLERELTPYARGNNTEVDGPQVLLRAEAGQSMAFVLHELTTNAAKYGALSTSEGKITVRWHWPPNGEARERLIIEWQEIGGPAVAAPCKSGYGTSVIRELIPHELGGKADLTITPQGVRCRMEIPGHWVERETAPIDGQSPLVARAGRGFDPLGAGSTDPR